LGVWISIAGLPSSYLITSAFLGWVLAPGAFGMMKCLGSSPTGFSVGVFKKDSYAGFAWLAG